MRKPLYLAAIIFAFTILGCKKKSTTPAVVSIIPIGSTYDDSAHTQYFYYYSPDGRIAGVHDDKGEFWTFFHYNGSQIEAKETVYGNLTFTNPVILYYSNANAIVDSSVEIFPDATLGKRKKYFYDSNGYLINVQWYSHQYVLLLSENFIITNGNVAQHSYTAVDSTSQDLPRGTSTYDYYTDKVNTLGNKYVGQDYLGVSSKNPVRSWTLINGSSTARVDYTYNYDPSGNISSQLIYMDSVGISTTRLDSISFSYYN